MPELPEVETVARLIRPRLLGRTIVGAEIAWERTLGALSEAEFRRGVLGARIEAVRRRAKWIVVDLVRERESAGHLLVHLRMSGRLHVVPHEEDPGPWCRVSLALDDGRDLCFVDVRKFGRMLFVEDPATVLAELGPEPLEESFTPDWLRAALKARRRALKPLLLDQTFLAGLGNIYVDEALHLAKLHPTRLGASLDRPAVLRLHAAIREILARAIEHEGSSFDPFYRTPEGQPGAYQDQFRVYGRQGQPCLTCGARIRKMVLATRGTHFCGRCQRPRPSDRARPDPS